jgi:hypothetical protein
MLLASHDDYARTRAHCTWLTTAAHLRFGRSLLRLLSHTDFGHIECPPLHGPVGTTDFCHATILATCLILATCIILATCHILATCLILATCHVTSWPTLGYVATHGHNALATHQMLSHMNFHLSFVDVCLNPRD